MRELFIRLAFAGVLALGFYMLASNLVADMGKNMVEQTRKSAERMQQQAAARQELLNQQRLAAQQEEDRRAVMAELKLQQLEEQRAAEWRLQQAELARKNAAFSQWWKMPGWCDDPGSQKAFVQCVELKRSKRAEFDRLWAAGRFD